jgi:hypothetical protein
LISIWEEELLQGTPSNKKPTKSTANTKPFEAAASSPEVGRISLLGWVLPALLRYPEEDFLLSKD